MPEPKSMKHLPSPLLSGDVFTTPRAAQAADTLAAMFLNKHELETTVAADPTMTPDGRTAELAKWAMKHEGRRTDLLTAAAYAIQDRRDQADADIDRPLRPGLGTGLQLTEIRQALRGMPADERRAVITAAAEAGDNLTIGAVVHGSGWLAGCTKSDQEYYRTLWARKHHPDAVAELELARVDGVRLDAVIHSTGEVWQKTIKAGADALAAQARTAEALKK